jgi:hypothetical protein
MGANANSAAVQLAVAAFRDGLAAQMWRGGGKAVATATS